MKILRIIILLSLLTSSFAQSVPTNAIFDAACKVGFATGAVIGAALGHLGLSIVTQTVANPILKAALPKSNEPSLWRKAALPALFLTPVALNYLFKIMSNHEALKGIASIGLAITDMPEGAPEPVLYKVLYKGITPMLAYLVALQAHRTLVPAILPVLYNTAKATKNLLWEQSTFIPKNTKF